MISDDEAASAVNGDSTSCDPLPVGGTSCDLLPEEKEDTHAYLEGNSKCLELSKVFENLLCPDWTKVSKKQPYRVQKNAAFVIDLGDQDPMMMIRNLESDDNGTYTCMGTRTSTWKKVLMILRYRSLGCYPTERTL